MIGLFLFIGLAFCFGVVLVFLDEYCNKKSKRQQQILALLPWYNCGSCGFGSCEGMSEAMLHALENYRKCKPLRGEAREKMEAYINQQT